MSGSTVKQFIISYLTWNVYFLALAERATCVRVIVKSVCRKCKFVEQILTNMYKMYFLNISFLSEVERMCTFLCFIWQSRTPSSASSPSHWRPAGGTPCSGEQIISPVRSWWWWGPWATTCRQPSWSICVLTGWSETSNETTILRHIFRYLSVSKPLSTLQQRTRAK